MDLLANADPRATGPFYFKKLGRSYLVTNDGGGHGFLSHPEFSRFVCGRPPGSASARAALAGAGFEPRAAASQELSARWARSHRFLRTGPGLHILVLTVRCNHRCLYCQATPAAMGAAKADMSPATAHRALDLAFQTPAPGVTVEFQGGEPLANWGTLRSAVDYARRKSRVLGKPLVLTLVSNLSLLDERRLDFLLRRQVRFCTSLDGPAFLHDANRPLSGGGSHRRTVRWIARIRERGGTVDALTTVTRAGLGHAREIVDEYARMGLAGIFLRPLSPLGLARSRWDRIGYSADEFLRFYASAFERLLELNAGGTRLVEYGARVFLSKILRGEDPNFLDLRSPCGAGIGQIAYDHDGAVYTCDEGRMLARSGDTAFRIGHVSDARFSDLVGHPAVRCAAAASCLETQPRCSSCVYKPFCGVCPVLNWARDGDLFGRMPLERCRLQEGRLDLLFGALRSPRSRRVLEDWAAGQAPAVCARA